MHRTTQRFLVRRLDGSHHQHTTDLCLFQKRREQCLLFFGGEVGMPPSDVGFAPKYGFAVTGVIGVQLTYGLRLPSQGLRDLRGA